MCKFTTCKFTAYIANFVIFILIAETYLTSRPFCIRVIVFTFTSFSWKLWGWWSWSKRVWLGNFFDQFYIKLTSTNINFIHFFVQNQAVDTCEIKKIVKNLHGPSSSCTFHWIQSNHLVNRVYSTLFLVVIDHSIWFRF